MQVLLVSVPVIPKLEDGRTKSARSSSTDRKARRWPAWHGYTPLASVPSIFSNCTGESCAAYQDHSGVTFLRDTQIPHVHCAAVHSVYTTIINTAQKCWLAFSFPTPYHTDNSCSNGHRACNTMHAWVSIISVPCSPSGHHMHLKVVVLWLVRIGFIIIFDFLDKTNFFCKVLMCFKLVWHLFFAEITSGLSNSHLHPAEIVAISKKNRPN